MLENGSLLQGRYRIERALQEGGMSIVYLGFDTSIDALVAIKEMKNQFVTELERKQAVEEFRKEARILARLHHVGLPRVSHFFEQDEVCYLVMDFIEGETLDRAVRHWGGRLPESVCLPWAWEISQVLEYLHQQKPPIIFRDLKPSNIIVTPDRHLKLIDFGIAKLFDKNAITHTLIKGAGTPGFAPPEQYGAVGRNRTDERSDIYALGATLYSLLAGELPAEATARFMSDEPLKPLKDVSPELQHLVNKCLALGQEERFQSTQEVMAALHPLVFTGPSAPHDGSNTLAPRPAQPEIPRPPLAQAMPTAPLPSIARPPAPHTEPDLKPPEPPSPPPVPEEKAGIPLSAALIARERELSRRGRNRFRLAPLLLAGGLLVLALLVASQLIHLTPPPPSPTPTPSPSPTPAPTASPVAVAGRLHILTAPADAIILVDGGPEPVLAGKTGIVLSLNPGAHVLRITRAGYLDQTVSIDVPSGGNVSHLVTLDRMPALTLRSVPGGAEVTVDGKPVGKTPQPLHLDPGLHQIVLTRAGYRPWKHTQSLKANDQIIVEAAMQKLPAPPPSPAPPPPPLPPPPRIHHRTAPSGPATPQPPKATPWQ
ncbi:MAG: protein kinase domain-containing protein [Candidatus Xenobia bacterium]